MNRQKPTGGKMLSDDYTIRISCNKPEVAAQLGRDEYIVNGLFPIKNDSEGLMFGLPSSYCGDRPNGVLCWSRTKVEMAIPTIEKMPNVRSVEMIKI
jgi:hypothetical protein